MEGKGKGEVIKKEGKRNEGILGNLLLYREP